jgi:hypothetical protein
VNSKLTPTTTQPFSFPAWRSHLPTLPRHETLRTELHRKVSNPKGKEKKRENVDLWLVKHGSAPDPYYLSVSLEYTEHNEAEI